MSAGSGNQLGFVGVGAMGAPMVACLQRAGFKVLIADHDKARAATVAQNTGAEVAASCGQLARACKSIVTMLPNSDIVESVLFGPDSVVSALTPGTVVIEMSSGRPARTRSFEQRINEAGGSLVDAPVSGGTVRAVTGELAIMVGGDESVVHQIKPILQAMGSSVIHTGSLGTAHAMKALNNLVSAGGFLIAAEALLIGARFGLDPAIMVDVLNVSSGMNNSTKNKFKQFVLSGKFNSGFSLDLMVKDLDIAAGMATEARVSSPFSKLCSELWLGSTGLLGKGLDHTEMARFCEAMAGERLERTA